MKLEVVAGGLRQEKEGLPPHDVFAEQAIIAVFLICEKMSMSVVQDLVPTEECFYVEPHRRIWRAMAHATSAMRPTDPINLESVLAETGQHGLTAKLIEIIEFGERLAGIESERRARSYAKTIRNRWIQRRYLHALRTMVAEATHPTDDVAGMISARLSEVSSLEREGANSPDMVLAIDTMKDEVRRMGSPVVSGARSGISGLDELLGSLRPKETTILAARTSVGKSTLAMQIATNVAGDGYGVVYASLEMTPGSLVQRLMSFLSGVNHRSIRDVNMKADDWLAIAAIGAKVQKMPLMFTRSQSMTMAQIVQSACGYAKGLMRDKSGQLRLVVIDHVGIVAPSQRSGMRNQQEELSDISRKMRWLAEETQAHVIGISQISRDTDKRQGEQSMPRLHELRGSGSLEQDADNVLILHRQRGSDGMFKKDLPARLALAKARTSGATGIVELRFEPHLLRFSDWS